MDLLRRVMEERFILPALLIGAKDILLADERAATCDPPRLTAECGLTSFLEDAVSGDTAAVSLTFLVRGNVENPILESLFVLVNCLGIVPPLTDGLIVELVRRAAAAELGLLRAESL